MARITPKKNYVPVRFTDRTYGRERREDYAREILHKEPIFPKPLGYEDIDAAFEEFVKDRISVLDDITLPVFMLYSNQRFSEYSQTWRHVDDDDNLLMNFLTIGRDNNPKPGKNQGELWNIPGDRKYTMLIRDILDDNGTESYEVYSMKQPYSVDLSYRISVMTTTYSHLNMINNRLNELFKARQCYIRPNGHYIPMVIEEINDETSYTIEGMRFFVQTFSISVMAYIINGEDFTVDRKPKRATLHLEGDRRRPSPKVEIEEYEDGEHTQYANVDVTIGFDPYCERVRFTIDTDMDVEEIRKENVRTLRVWVDDTPTFIDKGFKLRNGNEVRMRIRKFDLEEKSTLVLTGTNPNPIYVPEFVPEDVRDEVVIGNESIVVE